MSEIPQPWSDLIQALAIMSKHPANEYSPTHCSHDMMFVNADSSAFTEDEISRLEELGFNVDRDGGFYSFRFGSS